MLDRRSGYEYEDLLACGRGEVSSTFQKRANDLFIAELVPELERAHEK